jgi:hypothetical protein
LALFIWLIIRLIQFVFSAGTIFFSHKKSANSVFQPAYNSSRMAPFSFSLSFRCFFFLPGFSYFSFSFPFPFMFLILASARTQNVRTLKLIRIEFLFRKSDMFYDLEFDSVSR